MSKDTGDTIEEQIQYEKYMLDQCYEGMQDLAGQGDIEVPMFNAMIECFLLHAHVLVKHLDINELSQLPADVSSRMFHIGPARSQPKLDWEIDRIKRVIDERLDAD